MEKKTSDLIPIKKSHIAFYNNFALYYISESGEPVLYKKQKEKLDGSKLFKDEQQQFFIHKKDEASVVKTLLSVLNIKLAKAVSSKGIKVIKQALCNVVEEALEGPLETSLLSLPETIEILFYGAKKNSDMIDALASMSSNSPKIIEHLVNVLALTVQYCFYKNYPDDQIKNLCLCALLHDIGTTKIKKGIIETDEKLTDKEYKIYKNHTTIGYRDMQLYPTFDKHVAATALEHHECLDGSGYPNGIKNISFEAQVIGLIDSYEPLKYREKKFRKALNSYDALQIIRKDVMQGKYNKQVFIDLCSCLTK